MKLKNNWEFVRFTFEPTRNLIQIRTLTPGRPFAPRPVILSNDPAGSGCGCGPAIAADVTNKISKFGPPNATDVTCSTGSLISRSILPVLTESRNQIRKVFIYIGRRLKSELNNSLCIDFDDFGPTPSGYI